MAGGAATIVFVDLSSTSGIAVRGIGGIGASFVGGVGRGRLVGLTRSLVGRLPVLSGAGGTLLVGLIDVVYASASPPVVTDMLGSDGALGKGAEGRAAMPPGQKPLTRQRRPRALPRSGSKKKSYNGAPDFTHSLLYTTPRTAL